MNLPAEGPTLEWPRERKSVPLQYRWLRGVHPLRLRASLAFRMRFPDLTSAIGREPFARLEFAPDLQMQLFPTDTAHRQIWLTGFMELTLSRWIAKEARAGGLLVDVGANAGYFTLLWLRGGRENRAYCFEPGRRPVQYLAANLEGNRLTGRATVDRRAVGAEAGRMAFDPGHEDQTGWGGLVPASSAATVETEVVRLDDVFDTSERISVLKIDVEGADTWVLEGAERLLASGAVRTVFFEHNEPRMKALGVDPGRATEFLRRFGFRVSPLRGTHGTEWIATKG